LVRLTAYSSYQQYGDYDGRLGRALTEEDGMNGRTGTDVLDALIEATNRRDLDGIVARFAPDVRSDTPAHPARSFVGSDQVRRNWSQILGAIGDLTATISSSATSAGSTPGSETVWAEIAFDGRRPDGAPWRMRGVTVNEVVDGRIASLRFYLEPVDDAAVGADDAVRRAVGDGAGAAQQPVATASPEAVVATTVGAAR
jgi:ketosteroid isomerase-like protein